MLTAPIRFASLCLATCRLTAHDEEAAVGRAIEDPIILPRDGLSMLVLDVPDGPEETDLRLDAVWVFKRPVQP